MRARARALELRRLAAGGAAMPVDPARLARVEWVVGAEARAAGGGGEGWMSRRELRELYADRCRPR